MEFKRLKELIQTQFNKMQKYGLYVSIITGKEVWKAYINGFTPFDNPKFRINGIHNCTCCENFINRYGNIVSIIDGKIESIFSNLGDVNEYNNSVTACNNLLIKSKIENIFMEEFSELQELKYQKEYLDEDKYDLPSGLLTYKLGKFTNIVKFKKDVEIKLGYINSKKEPLIDTSEYLSDDLIFLGGIE